MNVLTFGMKQAGNEIKGSSPHPSLPARGLFLLARGREEWMTKMLPVQRASEVVRGPTSPLSLSSSFDFELGFLNWLSRGFPHRPLDSPLLSCKGGCPYGHGRTPLSTTDLTGMMYERRAYESFQVKGEDQWNDFNTVWSSFS